MDEPKSSSWEVNSLRNVDPHLCGAGLIKLPKVNNCTTTTTTTPTYTTTASTSTRKILHTNSQMTQVKFCHTRIELESKLQGNTAPHVPTSTTITSSVETQPPGKISTQQRHLTSPRGRQVRLLGKIAPQKPSVKESSETAVNRQGIPQVTTQSDIKEEHKLTKVQELLLKFSNKSVDKNEASNVNTQTKSKYKPAKSEDLCADDCIRHKEDNKATNTNRYKVKEDSYKFDMKFDEFDRKFVATVNEEDLQSVVMKKMKTTSQCAVQEKIGRQPAVQTSKEDILDEETAAQDSISLPEPKNHLKRLLLQQFVSPVEQPQPDVDVFCANPIGTEY